MKLLVDENLPPRVARSLQALYPDDHLVIALRDKFERPRVTDIEWIQSIGGEGGWSVLTADRRISRNAIERNAFLAHNLIGFVLSPGLRKKALNLQMSRLLYFWPTLINQSELVTRGLFEIGERSSRLKSL